MIEVKESRRLTGPNLQWDNAGAALEIYGRETEVESVVDLWKVHARDMLDAVGWSSESVTIRRFPGGACLAMSAPIDALYAATEVNEWAVEAALTETEGRGSLDLERESSRLRQEIACEVNPALLSLRDAASERGVSFIPDDEHVSLGTGKGSLTLDAEDLPAPGSIDWSHVHDIPVALVTGTNGKSTTVRLLASMVRTHGLSEGFSSTDGIIVDDRLVERGDYSGPEGARLVLRNRDTDIAILETARGGILRRGLPVRSADAALVTNASTDHLGEYGVNDLTTLTKAKLVVHRAVGADGLLVLNADDAGLKEAGRDLGVPVAWFSLDRDQPGLTRHLAEGGEAAWLEENVLVRSRERQREELIKVDEIPITMEGSARHNISNALAAILVAGRLGLSDESIRKGLLGFEGTPERNPGRGNIFELGGVTAIVDFAHNAHGFKALYEMVRALPADRWLVLLGQAGDRSDTSIREQVAITWKAGPDRIIIKEMESYLRGREKGEIPSLIESELRRLGAPGEMISHAECEMSAVRQALEWSRPGDLLLLLVYAERREVFDLLTHLMKSGWRPGEAF